MNQLSSIKERLKNINETEFQELCDSFLSKIYMKEELVKRIIRISSWTKRNLRTIIIWSILLALFILLESRISTLILKYNLIRETEINSRYFLKLYQGIKVIALVVFAFLFIKNYRLSKNLNFWFLFLATAYIILKSNETDKLEFIVIPSDEENNMGVFADVFLYLGYLTIGLFIRNLFGDIKFYDTIKANVKKWFLIEKSEQTSIYKEDTPIQGNVAIDNDIIVSTLSNQIADLTPTNAFVIGINGEWGNGKTTFLKRLDYKLKYDAFKDEKSPIIFWFNAWQHQDEKSIINNFFNQLKKELAKYSGDAKA